MRLRALEPEDLDFLYSIENDMSMWWLSSQTAPLSAYHLRDYVANNASDIYKDEQVRYVIEVDNVPSGAGSTAVGLIDLFNFSPLHRRAEVGIVIKREYRNRGYAMEAIGKIADYARDILCLHQIYAIVDNQNCKCLNLLRNAGFEDGTTLRHWLYSQDGWRDAVVMQYFLEKND